MQSSWRISQRHRRHTGCTLPVAYKAVAAMLAAKFASVFNDRAIRRRSLHPPLGEDRKKEGLMLSREGRALRVARRAESWESGLTSQWARAQAWLDLLVIDHGFLRLFY